MFRFVVFTAIFACVFGATIPNGLIPMLDGRIVGGQDTTIEEFPHQISLRYYNRHRCGGSIYNETVVITAAHCVKNLSPIALTVAAGSTYVNRPTVKVSVEKYYAHEGFSMSTLDSDIAVIILRNPLSLSDTVKPIPLQESKDEVESGRTALVSGWGSLVEGGSGPNILQYVEVTVVDFDRCAKAYRNIITESMLCAGHVDGGRDACQGDSGGPLISDGKLIGVVSWGYGCARPEYPGVYAKVSHLHEWIKSKIE